MEVPVLYFNGIALTMTCPECGGQGEIDSLPQPDGEREDPRWCEDCEGTGRKLTPAGLELVHFMNEYRNTGRAK